MTAALNGAGASFQTIQVAGLAFAIAGAISMFFSSYLSRKAELESLRTDIARESMEIETEPDEEMSEMRDLLRKDGYNDMEVGVILRRLRKDKGLWLKEMLRRELRVNVEDAESDRFVRPLSAGLSFFVLALLVMSPYAFLLPRETALVSSIALSLVALFVLGSRAFIPGNFRSIPGIESAGVGAAAGGLLYILGILVSKV